MDVADVRLPARISARQLLIVAVLALCVRVPVFLVSSFDPGARQIEEDSHGFITLASNLADGRGFARTHQLDRNPAHEVWQPELTRTPGYPAVLAVLFRATGRTPTAIVVLQHLATVGLCVGAAALVSRLAGSRAGIFAGVLLALDLHGASLGNLVLSEALFTVGLFAAAFLVARLVVQPKVARGAAAGVLLGLLALVKPTAMVLASMLPAVLVLYGLLRRSRPLLTSALCFALCGNLIVGAWIVRNGLVAGEYTFSSIPRYQLISEHAAGALARRDGVPIEVARGPLFLRLGVTHDQLRYLPFSAEENRRIRKFALDVIRENKGAFVKETAIRSVNMLFGPDKNLLRVLGLPVPSFGFFDRRVKSGGAPLSLALLGAEVLWTGTLYLLLAIGLAHVLRGRRPPAEAWVALAFAACVMIPSLGTPGEPRYRWPAMPLLVLFAALTAFGNRVAGPGAANTRSSA